MIFPHDSESKYRNVIFPKTYYCKGVGGLLGWTQKPALYSWNKSISLTRAYIKRGLVYEGFFYRGHYNVPIVLCSVMALVARADLSGAYSLRVCWRIFGYTYCKWLVADAMSARLWLPGGLAIGIFWDPGATWLCKILRRGVIAVFIVALSD